MCVRVQRTGVRAGQWEEEEGAGVTTAAEASPAHSSRTAREKTSRMAATVRVCVCVGVWVLLVYFGKETFHVCVCPHIYTTYVYMYLVSGL